VAPLLPLGLAGLIGAGLLLVAVRRREEAAA
jgi:hypothetical protein